MFVKDVLAKSNEFLKTKGFESSRLDAELIIAHVLKMERISLYLKFDQPLSENELSNCRKLIIERAKGVPVAYLLNKKYFYNLEFFVDERVLIPRPETELLVVEVLNWAKMSGNMNFRFLDMGCGSGCIAISIAMGLFNMGFDQNLGIGLDISKDAIAVAKINRENLFYKQPVSVANQLELVCHDVSLFNYSAPFDIIVANPPYIGFEDSNVQKSVKDFEPHLALFAKDNGLACIKSWCQTAIKISKPKGLIIFEIGGEQGREVIKIFDDTDAFSSVELLKDFSGFDRFIKVVRNG
jgi:release factor glutamine methyltransferase